MKPKRIFLIRHGESEGNVDKTSYANKPDYALTLTDLGREQASAAGAELAAKVADANVMFYVSPFWRTRETFELIAGKLKTQQITFREEPRLREQEWGHLRSEEEGEQIIKTRDAYGTFYFRFPDGESCADVYDRVTSFLDTFHRDVKKPDFPENVVIVTHGMTIRLFLMRWFRWSVEDFEALENPKNCAIVTMRLTESGKYKLDTEMPKHTVFHSYQRPVRLP